MIRTLSEANKANKLNPRSKVFLDKIDSILHMLGDALLDETGEQFAVAEMAVGAAERIIAQLDEIKDEDGGGFAFQRASGLGVLRSLNNPTPNSDGSQQTQVSLWVGIAPTLQQAQRFVSGCVEIVRADNTIFLVNSDGQPLGLAHNPEASTLAGQPILGNAIILRDKKAREGWGT